jgi:hypothetical protein
MQASFTVDVAAKKALQSTLTTPNCFPVGWLAQLGGAILLGQTGRISLGSMDYRD